MFVNSVGRTRAHLYTLANIHTRHVGRYVIYSCKSVTPIFLTNSIDTFRYIITAPPKRQSGLQSVNPYHPGGPVCPLNEPGKGRVLLLVRINFFVAYLE